MPFSDDDLKRWKEKNIGAHSGKPFAQVIMRREEFEALLSRLEAAERIAVLAPARWGLSETLNGLVEAWRKTAGKE